MTVAEQIVEYAGSLFDVVGVSLLAEGGRLLILGLESTPERNLDDFGHEESGFRMYGFEKYVAPRLEKLLEFIHARGFTAEPVGRYGYPLKGEINLKEEAIRSGLGKRGKNTVILHPVYGNRLRFMAVSTNAPLEPLTESEGIDEENPVCSQCSICIDACPVYALEPYRMPDISICLSNITPRTEEGRSILCDICLQKCPVG
jgi:epoxyqueuosine reductase QueG